VTTATLVPCPGCGGRNSPNLDHCDWCGRSFLSSGRHISARWVRLGLSLVFGAFVVVIVLLAVMNVNRQASARTPAPAATASPLPTPPAKAGALPSALTLQPSPTPTLPPHTATPVPEPTATPEPLRTARIARTGGAGVFLRREPTAAGPSITALREGTIVTVLSREEVTAARVWRLVRDSRGLEGWVLADYLDFLSE
jgi:hypothetical protein